MLNEKERKLVENHIYGLVKKAINENMGFITEKGHKAKSDSEKQLNKVRDKVSKSDNTTDTNKRRKVILKWLNSPSLNQTAIMRQLWHPTAEEEDSKRSFFFKKLHGELNDNGVPYQFSDEEITQLFKIKSHGAIG